MVKSLFNLTQEQVIKALLKQLPVNKRLHRFNKLFHHEIIVPKECHVRYLQSKKTISLQIGTRNMKFGVRLWTQKPQDAALIPLVRNNYSFKMFNFGEL